MARLPMRVYADTSVFGGVFDEEFHRPSVEFFNQVRSGRFVLVISTLVQEELVSAPESVRTFAEEMLPFAEVVELDERVYELRQSYLDRRILTERSLADATHVAAATVTRCQAIVSWNFAHIVSFRRIPLYNAVNVVEGFSPLAIHSPSEVIEDEGHEIEDV